MESSNFKLLQDRWPKLYEHASFAERYTHSDPHTAIIKLRCFAEQMVGILYRELLLPCNPNDGFFEKLKATHFQSIVDKAILEKLHAIRTLGNRAAHGGNVSQSEATILLHDAYLIGKWIYRTYSGALGSYPDFEELKTPEDFTLLLKEQNTELSKQLKAAKDELARLEESERLSQKAAGDQGVVAIDERLEEFRHASRASAESFDLAPGSTRNIISLSDSFAGYQLTSDQTALVSHLTRFLSNKDENLFLLKGYAGTGKTFITKGLTEHFRAIGRNYVLAAPTGKASKVIARKTGSEAYTIHKTIYSFKDLIEYREENLDGSETYKLYAQLAVNNYPADTVFIVDEASMIGDNYQEEEFFRFGSGYLLRDFLKFVNLDHNDHRKKVIFIGDDAQLPPVRMGYSPALDPAYLKSEYSQRSIGYELTEVVRQKANSGVMQNAIKLRQSLRKKVFNQLVVDYEFPDVEKIEYQDFLARYLESCSDKINAESIVIAQSNADVAAYNRHIREHFFPGFSEVTNGDKIMVVKNIYMEGMFVSNGDFGLIRRVFGKTETRIVKLRNKNSETGEIEETLVTLLFRDVEIGFKDLLGNPRFFEVKIIENLLYGDHPNLTSDESKALYVDFCIRHPRLRSGSLEFKETLRSDPYFNALHLKFGYAITCHKAQGSEWNHVFVKCRTHQNQLTADYFRWLYTATTRTADKLYLMDPPNIKLGSGLVMGGSKKIGIGPESKANEKSPLAPVEADGTIELDPSDQDEACTQMETCGIAADDHFSLEILRRVTSLIKDQNITIQSVDQKQYQECYFFQRDNQIARIVFYYNGKGKITKLLSPNRDSFSGEMSEILDPLSGILIVPETSNVKKEFVFADDFLNEFHARLEPSMAQDNIRIADVKQMDWKQRYTFVKSTEVAVIDFIYDGKSSFTNCLPVRNDCSSDDFINEIASALKRLDD